MKKVTIPDGYNQLMPYLIVSDANRFLEFMQTVFGAKEKFREMRDDETIKHGEVFIGGSVIMFAQSTAQFQPQSAGMFLYVDDADEVYLKALNAGATEIMQPADQPYGRSGGVQDPFGNIWWITSVV